MILDLKVPKPHTYPTFTGIHLDHSWIFLLIIYLFSPRLISIFWTFDQLLFFDHDLNAWTAVFLPIPCCTRNHPQLRHAGRWDAQPLGIGKRGGKGDGMEIERGRWYDFSLQLIFKTLGDHLLYRLFWFQINLQSI